ncbi:hypothetical protein H6G36_29260 [Anabaena minutissima FACHB-250]|nr:hypothetical protein [Anabaena minutissima FACHB-250]
MILDPLEQLLDEDDSSAELNKDTSRYLAHIEQKLYADIQTRKRFDSGLLFLACQVGAASLAWLLFSLQITLIIIQITSASLALLPGLIDLSDTFSFELSSERWEVRTENKPVGSLVKIGIGIAVGWTSTKRISEEIIKTHDAINSTYTEIRESEKIGKNELPRMEITLAVAVGLLILLAIFMRKNDVQTK